MDVNWNNDFLRAYSNINLYLHNFHQGGGGFDPTQLPSGGPPKFDPFTNNKVKNFWWTLFKDNIIYTTTFTQIIKLFRNVIKTFYTHSKSARERFSFTFIMFGQIIFYCVYKLSSRLGSRWIINIWVIEQLCWRDGWHI